MPDIDAPTMVPFAVALIAGGRSSRMGGRDKALLEIGGQPLWRRQLGTLLGLAAGTTFVSARPEQTWVGSLPSDVRMIPDPPGEDCGPIAGILRCLEAAQAPMIVLGIDLPQVTPDLICGKLLGRLGSGCGVFFRSEIGYEPLVGLYHPSMLDRMRDALQAGRLSLQNVIAECVDLDLAIEVPVTPEIAAALGNANTPEEWKSLSA